MNITEYKAIIDRLNADELVEVVRLARLSGDEKRAFEEVDIYEQRIKDTAVLLDIEVRKVDKLLQRAREKVINRVLNRQK